MRRFEDHGGETTEDANTDVVADPNANIPNFDREKLHDVQKEDHASECQQNLSGLGLGSKHAKTQDLGRTWCKCQSNAAR